MSTSLFFSGSQRLGWLRTILLHPHIFPYKISVKELWVSETPGPLDQGRAAATQRKESARTSAAPSCNSLSHSHSGRVWSSLGQQNLPLITVTNIRKLWIVSAQLFIIMRFFYQKAERRFFSSTLLLLLLRIKKSKQTSIAQVSTSDPES